MMIKKGINNKGMVTRVLRGAMAALAALFIASCTADPVMYPDIAPGDGKALGVLSVSTPKPALPGASTRIQTESEAHISGVKVLVFEKSGDNYTFSYYVNGTEVSGAGTQSQFKALLIGMDTPLKLVVLANPGDIFGSSVPSPGTPEANVRSQLNNEFTASGLQGDIPMYGEIFLPSGINADETYVFPVTVLRAVARVDVVKDLAANSTEFILEEVYAFRANNMIQLMPNALTGDSAPKVTAPSVPGNVEHLGSPVGISVEGGAESIIQLYVPEAAGISSNAEKVNGTTTIVVGGRYGGEGNPVTYYRVDFDSGVAGHPFGQVLRNYRYIFNIKSVSAPGWENPEDAADNLSSSIQVDVITWEDFSTEMYLGNDRFAVSSRNVSMRYLKDRKKTIDVESTFEYTIQWLEGGVLVGDATSNYGDTISTENFDAWIIKNEGDGEDVSHLGFRTLKNNNLGTDYIKGILRVTAGSWQVDIAVNQDYSGVYSDSFYNILSVVGTGDLGENLLENGASGNAMRAVLDKQFAPGGIIRIGGFSFNLVEDTPWTTETSAPENLAVMKRLIGGQSIIYLTNDARLSSEVGTILLDWVNNDPHRVLIVGTDTDNTNRQLLNKPQILQDGTWQFSGVSGITTNYSRAAGQESAYDFFYGPFGEVAVNATIKKLNNTAGYSMDYSDNVTPLITSDKVGYENYMFFGVNRRRRIIYDGDADLFRTTQMSNSSGDVSSDLDKLMANTWAWAVEQVIYGDS